MNMRVSSSIAAAVLLATLAAGTSLAAERAAKPASSSAAPRSAPATGAVPEAKHAGGEPDGIVQVANLVYAGTKSSKCFSDHFLIKTEKESAISTSRRFHVVKLASDEVYEFPLVIMTGEGAFDLTEAERETLRARDLLDAQGRITPTVVAPG